MQLFSSEALQNGAGFVLISNDLDAAFASLIDGLTNVHLFPKPYKEQQDLLVDDIDELFAEAYLTSETLKTIILKSVIYRIEVQNRLLKILEEPPHNIRFIIIAKTASALLHTIRSRISTYFMNTKKTEPSIRFDISKISLKTIFEFLKQSDRLDKEDAKVILYILLQDSINLYPDSKFIGDMEIAKFERAVELLGLNTQPKIIFADILLTLLRKRHKVDI